LLVPYRITPAGKATRQFLNAVIPVKMAVENILTGAQEILTCSTDCYAMAGYVLDQLSTSQVVGLFLMSDASYRLADKLGNEFWFDQAGHLTDMRFSPQHQVHFSYLDQMTDAFERVPYRLRPLGQEQVEFRRVRLPKRMQVEDLLHATKERLMFSATGRIVGYVPEQPQGSRYQRLARMSDASFRLLDGADNAIAFAASGDFVGMAPSPKRRRMRAMSHGQQRATFTYTLDATGNLRIAGARLVEDTGSGKATTLVRYHYDDEGRLALVTGPHSDTAAVRGKRKPAGQAS
jgi:hypothetical protein